MRAKIAYYLELFRLMLCSHGFHDKVGPEGCCEACGERLDYEPYQYNPGHYAGPLPRYEPETKPPSITCPICGKTSYHPGDIANKYCANCHVYHGDRFI